eukprot:NODE_7_length_67686_cov_1.621421.p35 type:complete len:219 gc:universal NODE_7_length_67686_cov_1.621421:29159-28503(-)
MLRISRHLLKRKSVEEAVSNILYNVPKVSHPKSPHILACLVQNEPGVLSRISGILAARGFNIDSLVVATTEVTDLSRMTIALRGTDNTIVQAKKQLEDLVPVWAVIDYTKSRRIDRELCLVKLCVISESGEDQLSKIKVIADLFNAHVVDVTLDTVTVEFAAKPTRIDAFLNVVREFGVVEMSRSGMMTMTRGHLELQESKDTTEEVEEVDITQLPPG